MTSVNTCFREMLRFRDWQTNYSLSRSVYSSFYSDRRFWKKAKELSKLFPFIQKNGNTTSPTRIHSLKSPKYWTSHCFKSCLGFPAQHSFLFLSFFFLFFLAKVCCTSRSSKQNLFCFNCCSKLHAERSVTFTFWYWNRAFTHED